MDFAPVEAAASKPYAEASTVPLMPPLGITQDLIEVKLPPTPSPLANRDKIRTSLRASTWDGVFAAIFSNVAGGVLLSNFLVELDASAVEIGMLASIPMLVNLIQPLGAYFADRTQSRHRYCLWIFTPSRVLWLLLVFGIALTTWGAITAHQLVMLTLGIVLATHILGALGSASWVSWLAVLVPRRLRGRYFGIRNSAASLVNLLSVPLLGLAVSTYPGGPIQGYGAILLVGVVAGVVSLAFQFFMVDVNPQLQPLIDTRKAIPEQMLGWRDRLNQHSILQDSNFLKFLLYFGLWMFAVNLSAPFFNLYMLDNLGLDVSWVTFYNSMTAGANLLMLVLWGKLADRVGNRPILIGVGLLVAVTPLLWLVADSSPMSIWLWLPALHLLSGGTWAAIDLCSNNIQMNIASSRHPSSYFAIAAAVAGVSGALGTTVGSFLAEFAAWGGLPGLFAISSILRLISLLPITFVQESRKL